MNEQHPVTVTPFDAALLGGLVLAVRELARGVERVRASGTTLVVAPIMIASGAIASGLTGGTLLRLGTAGPPAWMTAVVAGVSGAIAARVLVKRAAAMPVEDHEYDPRFAMQGVPAMVTAAIAGGDATGMIEVRDDDGQVLRYPARGLDGASLAAGTEVGVERIEDGIAYVEAWAAIETRL